MNEVVFKFKPGRLPIAIEVWFYFLLPWIIIPLPLLIPRLLHFSISLLIHMIAEVSRSEL